MFKHHSTGKYGWRRWKGYKNNVTCCCGSLCTDLMHAPTSLKTEILCVEVFVVSIKSA